MWRVVVAGAMPSFSVMYVQHTPSSSKSPCGCGGKCLRGCLSQRITARRLSLASALMRVTSSMSAERD